MKRRLPQIVLIVLAAVWVLTLLLWLRSHWEQDFLVRTKSNGHHVEIVTIPGQIRITLGINWPSPGGQLTTMMPHPWRYYRGTPPYSYLIVGQRLINANWYFPGFAVSDGSFGWGRQPRTVARYRTFAISFQLPLLLLSVFPAWLVFAARRTRLVRAFRRSRGLCAECGYDLRSSPHKCPECGAAPAAD